MSNPNPINFRLVTFLVYKNMIQHHCYFFNCTSKPTGKCACSVLPILFCDLHERDHMKSKSTTGLGHQLFDINFKPNPVTKNLLISKCINLTIEIQSYRKQLTLEYQKLQEELSKSFDQITKELITLGNQLLQIIHKADKDEITIVNSDDVEALLIQDPFLVSLKLSE